GGPAMKPRLRFAPSPSGYLHIGGARTALFNWLWARQQGGTFVLRVEDTDQERSSLDSVRAILDAFRWLGLDWDEGPEVGGPYGPYFQSERKELYREATERLIREGKAYRCYCTKEELDRAREELKAKNPKAAFVYPGTCRERRDEPDLPFVVRFKTPREGSTDFVDRVFGAIRTPNAAQQDFVLVRTDGYPLYNLAATVDDHEMNITLVARARDHIGNTPQQLLLYRAFGWEPPEFAHLPMMLSPKGDKLSKRHASVSVQEYRDRGYPPMGVLNYIVRFGWSLGDQEIFSRKELIEAFSWDRVNKSDGKFDEKKFADVAFEHLKRDELTPLAEYAERVRPFLEQRGLTNVPEDRLRAAIPGIRERARTLVDAAHDLDYYFREPPELDEKARAKFLTRDAAAHLTGLRAALADVEPWQAATLEAKTKEWAEASGLTMKDFAQAARVALTGRSASPPLFEVMVVLGREQTLSRLARGSELALAG
ncbi:MAG TPA: glutamate--tRNA ligase, partial [Polyangiaceae bacterium]|nr:glutamate--tRNA ligase [Polyangiaceae bacterium]